MSKAVKGKHYIMVNLPAPNPYYWDQLAQTWTTNAHAASFYDSRPQAEAQAEHAQRFTEAELVVCEATRDLP